MSADRSEIYRCQPPEGIQVPLLVQLFVINNDIAEKAEEDMVVQGLKFRRAGGPSGMRVEYLNRWIREANCKKYPERRRWELVVRLVQGMFGGGTAPEDIAWATMVVLPKGKGGYRGIGIVEVLRKVCSVVVNFRLKRSVVFHDALHGFREGQGIGTATLDAKLEQQLAGIAHEPLFQLLLDVCKAYDSMDRGR